MPFFAQQPREARPFFSLFALPFSFFSPLPLALFSIFLHFAEKVTKSTPASAV